MKERHIILAVISIIAILTLSFFIGNGFSERTDVVLTDYSVSEDDSKLTFRTAILSSMGYIRDFKDDGGGVRPHYLTFYSTFGGWNSSFGAKRKFELDLAQTDTEIYFNRPGGGYVLVLQKNAETGECGEP